MFRDEGGYQCNIHSTNEAYDIVMDGPMDIDQNGTGGQPSSVQEFIVKAPGLKHRGSSAFIGMFPSGLPGFRDRPAVTWSLARDRNSSESTKEIDRTWVLEDAKGCLSFRGNREAGLSGSAAGGGYFLLVKEGASFTAVPVEEWYNFRPVARRHQASTVEEAEARMRARGQAHTQANSKLAQLSATGTLLGAAGGVDDEDGGGGAASGSDGEDGNASDQEARAQRAQRAAPEEGDAAAGDGGGGGDDDAVQEEAAVAALRETRIDKGEDWEHEDDRQDDDLDMGSSDDQSGGEDFPGRRRQSGAASDDDDQGLSKSGRELQKLLRGAASDSEGREGTPAPAAGGTEAAAAEEGSESVYEDDDELDDAELDDDYLDRMAASMPVAATGKAGPSGNEPAGAAQPQAQPEPHAQRPATPSGGVPAANGPSPPAQRKGKRKGGAAATPPAAAEPGAAAPVAKKVKAEPTGVPTEAEVVSFLRSSGRVKFDDFTRKYKKRVPTSEQRKQLVDVVKRVAKIRPLEPGSDVKYVVLKSAK